MQSQVQNNADIVLLPKENYNSANSKLPAKFATPCKNAFASSQQQYSSSKAYSTAMKALQDRIKQLERETGHCNEQSKLIERTLEEEREKLQKKFLEELGRCSEIEKQVRSQLQEEQDKLTQAKHEIVELTQNKDFMMKQIQQIEREKERHLEQNTEEKELWRKEKNELLKKIEESNKKVKDAKSEKEGLMQNIKEISEKFENLDKQFERTKKDSETESGKLRSELENLKKKNRVMQKQHDTDIQALNAVNII